jgi:hypothetical protein
MPLHDWTRVGGWVHDDFRTGWVVYLRDALLRGPLPADWHPAAGPRAVLFGTDEPWAFGRTLSIRRSGDRQVVGVVELVSGAAKQRPASVAAYATAVASLVRKGVHVTLVDVLRPGRHDPAGLVAAVARELSSDLVHRQPFTLAAFRAGPPRVEVFSEDLAVGDPLPATPLFLGADIFVPLPLEDTYQQAVAALDPKSRAALEG